MFDISNNFYCQCIYLDGTVFKICVFYSCLLMRTSQKRRDVFMPPRMNVWGFLFSQNLLHGPLRGCLKVGTEKTLLGVTVFLLNLMTLLTLLCVRNFELNSHNKEIWTLEAIYIVCSCNSIPPVFQQSHKLCCARY